MKYGINSFNNKCYQNIDVGMVNDKVNTNSAIKTREDDAIHGIENPFTFTDVSLTNSSTALFLIDHKKYTSVFYVCDKKGASNEKARRPFYW